MVADRLRVPPWALESAPSYWLERARLALVAENGAQEEIRRRDERRSRLRQMMGGGSTGGRRRR